MVNTTTTTAQGQGQAQAPAQQGGQQTAKPGTEMWNPAEPYASTVIPERQKAEAFLGPEVPPIGEGYPKLKYHPVHGGVEVKNGGEEARLLPHTDWFDSPELADLARTWTEAEIARAANLAEKLKILEKHKLMVVRNSAQADEAIRRAQPEPL